jgi:hypothetical protein
MLRRQLISCFSTVTGGHSYVAPQEDDVDPELTALTSTAATTVMKLLATAAWERATSAVGRLWRRVHPVARHDHGTTVSGFLPRGWDHPVASDGTTRRVAL